MRRILCALLSCLLLLVTGCSTGSKEKVNVIKGAGMANNSPMVSFNELCEGMVGGFLDGGKLLVVRKNSSNYEFSIFSPDTASPVKTELPVVPNPGDFSLEISPDGKQFICGDTLVNIEKAAKTILPTVPSPFLRRPGGLASLPSCSFAGKNEVLLTNPFYYINKYFPEAINRFTSSLVIEKNRPLAVQVRETGPTLDINGFRNMKLPDIDFIKTPTALIDDLRYVFIGGRQSAGESSLYVLDLFTKKFNLIDTGVGTYTVSPDRQTLAYVKKIQGDKPLDRIYTAGIEGQGRKELAGLPEISGLAWSGNSRWLAYTGGEKSGSDLWIVRADGTDNEQLTHGMVAGDRLAWSGSGDKIAFTGGQGTPKVYIVTLNLAADPKPYTSPAADDRRVQTAQQMLELIREETSVVLSWSQDHYRKGGTIS